MCTYVYMYMFIVMYIYIYIYTHTHICIIVKLMLCYFDVFVVFASTVSLFQREPQDCLESTISGPFDPKDRKTENCG